MDSKDVAPLLKPTLLGQRASWHPIPPPGGYPTTSPSSASAGAQPKETKTASS